MRVQVWGVPAQGAGERALLAHRYFTPKADGAFTCLWFHVVPLDEHTTRVFNHAVIVQPMHPALKARTTAATGVKT